MRNPTPATRHPNPLWTARLRILVRQPERMRHAGDEVLVRAAVARVPEHGAADDIRIAIAIRRIRSVLAAVVVQERRAPAVLDVAAAPSLLGDEVEDVDAVLEIRRVALEVRPEQLSESPPRRRVDLHQTNG